MKPTDVIIALVLLLCACAPHAVAEQDNVPPEGFVALFNGKDFTGWKGLLAAPNDNPIKRAQLTPEQLAAQFAGFPTYIDPHEETPR